MKYIRLISQWILPLFSAFVIWMMIVTNKDYTIIIDTPIEIYEPRPDKILKNEVPASAQVLFRGSGRDLMYSKYIVPPQLILDVSTISRYYQIDLNEYFTKYPNRVLYTRGSIEYLEIVYPESVNVQIDEKLTKEIPVHINAEIQTRSGYIITKSPVASPEKIAVSGPRSTVRKLKVIESEAFNMSAVSQSIHRNISLINPDPGFLNFQFEEVAFNVKVESIGERIISNIPIVVVNAPKNLNINVIPPVISLTIVGGNDLIQNIKAEDIELHFDYASQWLPNTYYYAPEVGIPNLVMEWKAMSPAKVEVIIVRK
ncbi:MAG: YbbR-like domain-containing protein [Candidatus Marinimicrobia bacterium]|nr:YbbR-like domain-containing protein [Candidatus Neomarinimicrobiota bacterium]